MSTVFVISYLFLWATVILMGAALFILYSHVGERLVLSSREGHALQGPDLAAPLEPRTLTDLKGKRVTLGGPSAKPTLIIYASVSCQPCRGLLRALPELVQRYSDRIITILVCRGSVAAVSEFTSALPKEVTVCPDERGEIVKPYRILITPYALSLDREGTLVYKGVPGPDLDTVLHFVRPLVQTEEAKNDQLSFSQDTPLIGFASR